MAALVATTLLTPAGQAHETERRSELFAPGVAHAENALPSDDAAAAMELAGYGDFGFDSGTEDTQAREAFARGIALLWGFNHAAAVEAFRAAQSADPTCSACFWGEAYALGPNLNDGMHKEHQGRAAEAARLALGLSVTPRDRMLAAAVVARYDAGLGDRAAQDQAFADTMANAAEKLSENPNVQVIYADALMNLQPWDYWEADGTTPKGRADEILATLERAIELDPEHPGALHLYIHAVEASADPAMAEAAADALRGAVPVAGHLLHMPAHIYNRVGRYADSIAVNKAAIAADQAYLEAAGDAASPLYRYGYYPHNIHFLLVGAQMAGLKEETLQAADLLSDVTSDEVSGDLAWVQAIDTAPYAAHAQLAEPEAILALPDPGDRFPFVKGHWHWARGTALALTGDLDAALAEQQAIERILAEADLSGLEAQYLPASDVLEIAKHLVEARICQAEGDWHEAEHHLDEAIRLEDSIAYMEPPYWSYPVRQTLGAVRLQAGDALGAREAFEGALKSHPNNAWALWGLWQAEKALANDQLDQDAVNASRRAFERAWLGDGEPAIARL
jgi:tetratricopeptide (TPR) repeat protein